MWQLEGSLRAGAALLRDVRVSSSGLPSMSWNNGDVHGPDPDIDAAREFFVGLPWGMRVPAGWPFPHGRLRFRMPLMALERADFSPAPPVDGLELREAGSHDLETVVALDTAAFADGDAELGRRFFAAHFESAAIRTALGLLGGEPVATAFTVRTGDALYLGGVGVLPEARRRGIGAAVSSWLLEEEFGFAHLWPDTDAAARIYGRIGFRMASALDVYAFS